MRSLPHAEDRTDHRQCQRAQPYVQIHHAGDDRATQDSQCVHGLSHGSVERVGHRGVKGMDRDIAMASGTMRGSSALCVASALLFAAATGVQAQEAEPSCTFICKVEWKFEPTFTIENLHRHRVVTPDGVTERVNREYVFETVLALDLKTKLPRLGFTAEMSAAPFEDDNSAQLEFETNFYWL